MKIDLELLRASIDKLLRHAMSVNGREVVIDDDFYWFVQKAGLYDPTTTPTDLTLGSLHDECASVLAVGTGNDYPIGYHLVWAAGVLRAIGDLTLG